MDLHKKAARRATATGKRFVAMSGNTVVGAADTVSDLALISAVSDVDFGEVLEVTGTVVLAVGEIAGGIIGAIGDS